MVIVPKDIYNMDEIGPFYRAQPNKPQVQGNVYGRKIQIDRLNLVINMKSIDKLKLVIIYKPLRPRCFGRRLATNYV